jgi:hypothetical protein
MTYSPEQALPVLACHGLTLDTARAENVAFACLSCGSIFAVTPTATSSREAQRDLIDLGCCGEVVKI